MKLIVLYKKPEDIEAFDRRLEQHLPLLAEVPGVTGYTVTRFTRTFSGDGFYVMTDMQFASRQAMKLAMNSPEMAAVGKDAQSFAAGLMTMMLGDELAVEHFGKTLEE